MISDTHAFAYLRIPFDILEALDSRRFHYLVQGVHHLVRMAHILAMGTFFGAVALLDLRLMGWRSTVNLRGVVLQTLPILYWSFGITFVTGLALFFYDPVHTGSHAYFTPKMILIVLAMAAVAAYRRTFFGVAMVANGAMPSSARIAGALSLVLWTGVVVCSCLNREAAPKVTLQPY